MSIATQKTLLAQLKNPFDLKFVKWRVGATDAAKTKGIALAYLDAREVIKRLDEVCGMGGWQTKFTELKDGYICELSLLIDDVWITKSDAAGLTHVEGVKGGASSALKRAAAVWGIGRYLYYLPNVWVPIKPLGKSYALTQIPELPDWAHPTDNLERWEDVAELELDASATADDMQDVVSIVVTHYDNVRNAKTADDLTALMDSMTAEEQAIMSDEISKRTKEILADEAKA